MNQVSRTVLIVLSGLVLLAMQTALSPWTAPNFFCPSFLLPLVIGLAIFGSVAPAHGALIALFLGYLQDLMTGNPFGVQAFVMVVVFLVTFIACGRFSFRGLLFQLALTFVMTFGAAALTLLLRALFAPSEVAPSLSWVLVTLGSSAATAALAPLVFAFLRRNESRAARRSDEIAV